MLIRRIQRTFELSDVVEIQVFFQDRLATTYTLTLSEPLFNTLAEHLCFNRAGLRLPIRDTIGGKLVPRRWKLELRLEGSVDKELLDKIQLADPEIKVLSPESDPQVVEQSIRVGTEVSEPVPISIGGQSRASEDRKTDAPNPITTTEAPAVEIKILQEPKMEEKKSTGTQDRSRRDDSAPEDKSRAKTPPLKGIFKPAVPRVAIRVAEGALSSAEKHAATSHNEVGGVLVGKIEPKNKDDTYSVEIWDAIAGKDLISRGASVTFTADTWSTAIREVEAKYDEDLYIVGWYHTHPGFGVFMSGYDRFIHENYFNEPWQIALVIDPHAKKRGFFAWHVNDEKEQILEKYQREIEYLEGTWQPPVKQPPKDPTEPEEPTKKEEPKEGAVAHVPVTSEREKGEEKSEPSREPITPQTPTAENQSLPSEGTLGQVVDSRSVQDSQVHREHVVQQAQKPPNSAQVSVPVSEDSPTPSANQVGMEVVSQQRLGGKKAGIVALVVSSVWITFSWLRGRR